MEYNTGSRGARFYNSAQDTIKQDNRPDRLSVILYTLNALIILSIVAYIVLIRF